MSAVEVCKHDTQFFVKDPISGGDFCLLQVDQLSGLWVVRSRFAPGMSVRRHLHSGMVNAITLSGYWSYPEASIRCGPGDYLTEQAGAIHSLAVEGENHADIIFMIHGSILYFDQAGNVDCIEDWRTALRDFRDGCSAFGHRASVLGIPMHSFTESQ
ncbi:2,4'-dihydroxyacetophenone dioxygenase family protein [Frankia sp. Mgl5]|uniref:2,4'-dihydroxyacetophenone dioxygenase family protein n=1 Tax=Frankia sp. Mgl5 TaxID=2933793 RepID=UPI00200C734A|nr:2,4'-dihydroxyacetophenone dioxygenase family protein [Frankia sp. Mgl5]